MREYFCKIPNTHYLSAEDLVRDVNSGKEVFLLDLTMRPNSFIINPRRRKGGRRLRINDKVSVTNESMLWLVTIRRNSIGYFARQEGHSSRDAQPAWQTSKNNVAPIPQSSRSSLYTARPIIQDHKREVLEGPVGYVQRRSS